MAKTPEEQARENIDQQLEACGWQVQDRDEADITANLGVAIREIPLRGDDEADYLLYASGKAIGVVEAKPEGTTLTGVEIQSAKYTLGLPDNLPAYHRPLPFAYESTGKEIRFTNSLDPDARSREVFTFHRPETLIDWAQQPQQLRGRLRSMPPLVPARLWVPWVSRGYRDSHLSPVAADCAAYPNCDILNGDVDGDGTVNNFDVDDFVALLTSGNDAISVEYVWDGENRLKEFIPQSPQLGATHKLEFVYDYLGRRVHKKVYDWDSQAGNWEATTSEERKFIYDDWRLLLELDDSNDVLRKYTWGRDLSGSLGGAGGIGGLLSVYDADAEDDYVYFYDANGNVGQLAAYSADVLDDGQPPQPLGTAWHANRLVARYEYDPYGDVVDQDGAYADANPLPLQH